MLTAMAVGLPLFSQEIRFVGSFGGGLSFGSFRGLNYVIDRYNETRQGQPGAATLTRNMHNMHTLPGINWRAGILFGPGNNATFYLGIMRQGRTASTFAKAKDINGNETRRDLRFTANIINVDLGIGGIDEHAFFLFGLSSGFIFNRAYTKITGQNEYQRVMDELGVGLSPFIDFNIPLKGPLGIGIRASYMATTVKTNFGDLNKAINPATYINDPPEKVESRMGNFSLNIMMNIVL